MTKEPHGFILDSKILSNDCREDCFNYASHAGKIYQRLKSMPGNSIAVLVGDRGIGKTFLMKMLAEVNDRNTSSSNHWFYFDVGECLEDINLWDPFRAKLGRVIRRNIVRRFVFELLFMIDTVRYLVFRTKDNAWTQVASAIIWTVGFAIFFVTVVYVVIILLGLIVWGVLLGILPIFAVPYIFRYLDKKNHARKEGR